MKIQQNFIFTNKDFKVETQNDISNDVQRNSMERVIKFYNFLRPKLALQDYVYMPNDRYNILGYEQSEYSQREFNYLVKKLSVLGILDKNNRLDKERYKEYYKEYEHRYLRYVSYE